MSRLPVHVFHHDKDSGRTDLHVSFLRNDINPPQLGASKQQSVPLVESSECPGVYWAPVPEDLLCFGLTYTAIVRQLADPANSTEPSAADLRVARLCFTNPPEQHVTLETGRVCRLKFCAQRLNGQTGSLVGIKLKIRSIDGSTVDSTNAVQAVDADKGVYSIKLESNELTIDTCELQVDGWLLNPGKICVCLPSNGLEGPLDGYPDGTVGACLVEAIAIIKAGGTGTGGGSWTVEQRDTALACLLQLKTDLANLEAGAFPADVRETVEAIRDCLGSSDPTSVPVTVKEQLALIQSAVENCGGSSGSSSGDCDEPLDLPEPGDPCAAC